MLKDRNQMQLKALAVNQISDSYSIGTEMARNFV